MQCRFTAFACWAHLLLASGAEYHGEVRYRDKPLPGATVTLTTPLGIQSATTDAQGRYQFRNISTTVEVMTLTVFMTCFAVQTIPAAAKPLRIQMEMLPADEPCGATTIAPSPPQLPGLPTDTAERASEQERALTGYLINGSVDNSSDSEFAQSSAFGNVSRGGRSAYFGSLLGTLGSSALNARPYSITGLGAPPPAWRLLNGVARLSGPLSLPRKTAKEPAAFFVASYEWSRNRTAQVSVGRMPTPEERIGDLSSAGVPVLDPLNGVPFPGGVIPAQRLSRQATILVNLYPEPGVARGEGYNFERPVLRNVHRDAWNAQITKILGPGHLTTDVSVERVRSDETSVFGFLDRNQAGGEKLLVTGVPGRPSGWQGSFTAAFERRYETVLPFFAGARDVAGEAGIQGAEQRAEDWGPPNLFFAGGMSGLRDVNALRVRLQNFGISAAENGTIGTWQLRMGFNYGRRQRNRVGLPDARGTFSFTGESTGLDWADFLLGRPATAALAAGLANRYLRANDWAAFLVTEWRPKAGFTLNLGTRWEYSSPFVERDFRLANLAVTRGFESANAFAASAANPALLPPYRLLLLPRVALAWLPVPGSSLVVRAGYGIYADTGVYEALATALAAQPPFGRNFAVGNLPGTPPLSLASALTAPGATLGTYGIDARFRPGTAQNWQFSVERDLGWGLVAKAAYLGVKGTHAQQAFYPNTFPAGGLQACVTCPAGFLYMMSGGNSSRHAGQFDLRRRLRGDWSARSQVTWAKSIDNASLGGGTQPALLAQNWANLAAERGRSNFDQRVTVRLTVDYTFRFTNGWRQRLFDEWRFTSDMTTATGLPITPLDPRPLGGTGFVGSLRPDVTGESIYAAPAGLSLNPGAFSQPADGAWGNAGRNIITGPRQFALNASLWRTIRLGDRISADLRINATNPFNNPIFTRWDATLNSLVFGLPVAANAMRSIQLGFEVRY